MTIQGGNSQPMIVEENKVNYLGYIEHGIGQHQSNTVSMGMGGGYVPMIVETKDEYTQNN